jgi:hypothetical protein
MTARAIAIIEVDLADGTAPADVARRLALPTAKPRDEAVALGNFFSALTQRNAKVRVRVDSCTGVAASLTTAITGANIAAAEWIGISTPQGTWKVTAVASGAASGDGTFNTSGTNSTAATNISNAINSLAGLKDHVVATTNSGDLIITAAKKGSIGNVYRVVDGTGNGISSAGLLSGGLDTDERTTAAIAITNVTAADTVTIGTIAFTAVASGATGNQFNIGASATLTGDALAAAINASTDLSGLVTAINASGTVTLTYQIDARAAEALCRLATSDATAFGLTQPATTLTVSNAQATREYALGAA